MKKLISVLLLMVTFLMADLQQVSASPKFIEKNIKIIDIRTPAEWKETGIVKGFHTIMFFDEKGNYDMANFLVELSKVVTEDESFALICRVGSCTSMLAPFYLRKLAITS